MTTQQGRGSGMSSGQGGYPVDNATYNLLQASTSALESIEAYRKYAKDGDQQLFEELADEASRNATKLLDALHRRLMGGGGSHGSGGSMGGSHASGGSMGTGRDEG